MTHYSISPMLLATGEIKIDLWNTSTGSGSWVILSHATALKFMDDLDKLTHAGRNFGGTE